MSITIEIPNYIPAALNQYVGKHWAVMAKLKKHDKFIIGVYCRKLEKASKKRRVDCHYVLAKGMKARDPDSYWKSVFDALVHAGMLVDDSPKWVELGNVEYSRGIVKKTIIALTDIL